MSSSLRSAAASFIRVIGEYLPAQAGMSRWADSKFAAVATAQQSAHAAFGDNLLPYMASAMMPAAQRPDSTRNSDRLGRRNNQAPTLTPIAPPHSTAIA